MINKYIIVNGCGKCYMITVILLTGHGKELGYFCRPKNRYIIRVGLDVDHFLRVTGQGAKGEFAGSYTVVRDFSA